MIQCPRAFTRRLKGAASVEMILAVPLLLVLVIGCLEFALIYRAKLLLNHAATLTVRAGTLNHGCKSAMYDQFQLSMAPLLLRDEKNLASYTDASRIRKHFFPTYTFIETVSPNRETFNAHKQKIPLLPEQIKPCAKDKGLLTPYQLNLVIPHTHLSHRNSSAISLGGGEGAISIQDANLLQIRVRYCHKLITPFFADAIEALQWFETDPDPGPFLDYCIRGNGTQGPPVVHEKLLVLSTTATARMQTPFIANSLQN